jgi:hypothetical protein
MGCRFGKGVLSTLQHLIARGQHLSLKVRGSTQPNEVGQGITHGGDTGFSRLPEAVNLVKPGASAEHCREDRASWLLAGIQLHPVGAWGGNRMAFHVPTIL